MQETTENPILAEWMGTLDSVGARVKGLLSPSEQQRHSRGILRPLLRALDTDPVNDFAHSDFDELRQLLVELSAIFAERGLTPSETANYIFSLKEVLFEGYKLKSSGTDLANKIRVSGKLVDQLGLFTFEAYTSARERIIKSQAQAIGELATPVVRVWDGIIALPLVGSIDSVRAKDIMETLLDAVVAYAAEVVIIDITGVSVVDTQVANRLMRTVEAVRLLGTKSIITGINPVIAQTLVQLGIELEHLTTKSSLQAGLQQAFRELGIKVSAPGSR
jgi:rsbT co-antagonist protein RsbR